MKRTALALLAALLLLAGCSTGGGSDDSMGAADYDAAAQGAIDKAGEQAESGGAAGDAGTSHSDVGPQAYLVREAQVGIKVDDIMDAARQVREIADAAGGSVTKESFGDGYYGTAGIEEYGALTISVPSDGLDDTLARLAEIGEVQSRSSNAYNVQDEYIDVEARIATLTASIDRMRDLIEQTNDIDQIVRLESALSARQADLDSLQARLNALKSSIAMSPVEVRLTTTGDLGASSTGISGAFSDAWNAFLTSAGLLVRTVGALLPWIIVGGLGLWLLIWLINRSGRRSPKTPGPTPADDPARANPRPEPEQGPQPEEPTSGQGPTATP